MQKLLVMTDIHIKEAGETIVGLDPLARFEAALDQALARHPDARALILMGDLTHHGRPAQYARLAEVLNDLPLPVIPMIGNHDRRDTFLAAFPDAPQSADGHVQAVLDLSHHRVITLDTLDGPPYATHAGRLCQARLDWLAEALDSAGGRIPLVFAHHPFWITGIPGMDAIRLIDGDPVIDLIAQHPGAHVFAGHIHRSISGSVRGLPWTMFKSTCHQGPLDLISPDSSLSTCEPGAYGVLLLPQGGVVAHTENVGVDDAPISERASIAG